VSAFFRTRRFARVAVAATSQTKFHVDLHTVAPVLGMLKEQIARVVALTPCATVALIFESSQRVLRKITKLFFISSHGNTVTSFLSRT
jgi:hypothetical protein